MINFQYSSLINSYLKVVQKNFRLRKIVAVPRHPNTAVDILIPEKKNYKEFQLN
jgi:hypothetical protein